MFDVDYAPGVFAGIIFWVFILPALYGMFVVDKYWKKHQEEKKEDVFN
jgi:hypothetical protein